MKNYLVACLALQISLYAQAQSDIERSPLDPIYAALQRAAPTPEMRPIPEALVNSCNPRSAEIKDELAFESGAVHYMLGRLYVWHTYKQLDGSLCAYLDAPAAQMLTRNDLQALETVSWLKTPQVPSISADDGPPAARAISPDFVRSYSHEACESDAAPTGNVMMITPFVGVTTATLANQSGVSQGCVYSAVQVSANPLAGLRRIDLVRKAAGAGATGLANVAFVELQEAALVQPPPYRFFGNASSNPNNVVPRAGDFGYAIVQTGISGFAFPGTFEYINGKLNIRQIVQPAAPSGCPGLIAPPAIFGGALVIQEPQIGLEGVVGVVSGVSAACLGGTLGGIFGVNRYAGERLTAAEFTRFESFVAATQPALALHLFAPIESSTIDIALPSTQLGCNGPTASSEIAWRSSVISPVTGTFQVGTGCYISANKLARGTQMLTVYRSTDPTRKSSVKVSAMKSEATLGLSHTGDYVLPMGSYYLNLQVNWNSQDVGSQLFLTEQIDNNAEELLSDALYGATSRQINTDHVAKYRLRRAMPNAVLTGAVLDEKQVTVLSTAVVPLETPTMVTYPFLPFTLQTSDCPTGLCTFVLRWQSDGAFGVRNEIRQRRLNSCSQANSNNCVYSNWESLADATGGSYVIYFAPKFGQPDGFQYTVRSCAQFRGCSEWSEPVTSIGETQYFGSISVTPQSASWTNGDAYCKPYANHAIPKLTITHDYPFPLTLHNGTGIADNDPQYARIPRGTTSWQSRFAIIYSGGFTLGGGDEPILARKTFHHSYTVAPNNQSITCSWTANP